ncbi:hypothetical protein FKM82_029100 [Ascaphus truei]
MQGVLNAGGSECRRFYTRKVLLAVAVIGWNRVFYIPRGRGSVRLSGARFCFMVVRIRSEDVGQWKHDLNVDVLVNGDVIWMGTLWWREANEESFVGGEGPMGSAR